MADNQKQKPSKRSWFRPDRSKLFTTRYFLTRALIIVVLFVILHTLGWREQTSIFSGTMTADKGTPQVLAALMRVAYHVCSGEALSGIPRILQKKEPSPSEWLYLNFTAVSLPGLLESEIVRKIQTQSKELSTL